MRQKCWEYGGVIADVVMEEWREFYGRIEGIDATRENDLDRDVQPSEIVGIWVICSEVLPPRHLDNPFASKAGTAPLHIRISR